MDEELPDAEVDRSRGASPMSATPVDAQKSTPQPQPALSPGTPPSDVIAAACRVGGISIAKLLGRNGRLPTGRIEPGRWQRSASVIRLRAASAWIMRERLKMSLPEIGHELGYGDHTTVLYHLKNTCTKGETVDAVRAIEAEMRRVMTGAAEPS